MKFVRPISPETISQAGAGALVAAVGIVELWLAYGTTAWWYRFGASMAAAVGVLVLARALAVIVAPIRPELVHRVSFWERAPRPNAERRVLLAE